MAKLKIDHDMLWVGMEWRNDLTTAYLDKQTGEIVLVSEDELDPDEAEQKRERLDEEPGRYVEIEPVDSHEGYQRMEDFILSLSDRATQEALSDALDKPRPFRRFKDALDDSPDAEQQWYDFEAKAAERRMREWLEEQGIDAELVDRSAQPKDGDADK